MQRWSHEKSHDHENLKVDAFLVEINEVCKRHGLSISHEDSHGSFMIDNYSGELADWLMAASDNT